MEGRQPWNYWCCIRKCTQLRPEKINDVQKRQKSVRRKPRDTGTRLGGGGSQMQQGGL